MCSKDIALSASHQAVLVWTWESAPEEFRALSTSGGDEDYVMYVPPGVDVFDSLYNLSPWSNYRHKQLDGSEIVIGSHA